MGKRTVHIAAGFFLVMGCITMWAQKKTDTKKTKSVEKHEEVLHTGSGKALLVPKTYLGHSDFSGGNINYLIFDSLLQQGLYARDESGKPYKIVSFFFNYAERKVYEDSVGNLKMMIDYASEPCFGNKVDSAVANAMYERIKGGDTVYVERVLLTQEAGTADTFLGKGMKCVITK